MVLLYVDTMSRFAVFFVYSEVIMSQLTVLLCVWSLPG